MRAQVGVMVGSALVLAACTGGGSADGDSDHPWSDDVVLVSSLSSFDACDDLLSYATEHALDMVGPWGLNGGRYGIPIDDVEAEEAEDAAAAEPATGGALREGVDYSGTNVQEAGVDEPDTVKTDGRYLYISQDESLNVVDVTGDDPELLSTIRLGGWGNLMLLADDRLLVMGENEGRPLGDAFDSWAHGPKLILLDVSTPSDPTVVSSLELDGWVLSARLVDGVARVVVHSQPMLPFESPETSGIRSEREAIERNREIISDSTVDDWLPYYLHTDARGHQQEGVLLPCERVSRPDEFSGLGTTSVLSFDLSGDLTPRSATGVIAEGDTVYASPDELVVATNRWVDWSRLSGQAVDEANERFTTDLHAFDISDPDDTRYVGSGTVRGHVMSQWSMSIHDGVLRVATTEGSPWWSWNEDQPVSESLVTTFAIDGGRLEQLGQVGELGYDERIYAVRFMGEIGYVVTFRETDPLYTIDLSDPTKPQVLGELKIMGYSAYLHPVGDGLVLGVGQDADERGTVEGLQLSLFDVSDLADPQRIHQVTLPDAYSGVEWDHHAFLHWPATGLTVVPYESWQWEEKTDTENVDSGALAYRLDRADGFIDLGRLTHLPEDLADSTHPRHGDLAWRAGIQRSVVIGDSLYTISQLGVKASDLNTLDDVGWVSLPLR
jgi:uncharacterized secreted protein with C-terminal beta-propeller domain